MIASSWVFQRILLLLWMEFSTGPTHQKVTHSLIIEWHIPAAFFNRFHFSGFVVARPRHPDTLIWETCVTQWQKQQPHSVLILIQPQRIVLHANCHEQLTSNKYPHVLENHHRKIYFMKWNICMRGNYESSKMSFSLNDILQSPDLLNYFDLGSCFFTFFSKSKDLYFFLHFSMHHVFIKI
jgi:hypothetical protein